LTTTNVAQRALAIAHTTTGLIIAAEEFIVVYKTVKLYEYLYMYVYEKNIILDIYIYKYTCTKNTVLLKYTN